MLCMGRSVSSHAQQVASSGPICGAACSRSVAELGRIAPEDASRAADRNRHSRAVLNMQRCDCRLVVTSQRESDWRARQMPNRPDASLLDIETGAIPSVTYGAFA